MVYISQLLGKPVYFENASFGTLIDIAVFANRPNPPVSKFEIKHNGKKLTVSPQALDYINKKFYLKSKQIPLLPYDHNDFYLGEDLLDKQVIDIDGRRMVRVNDVMIDTTAEMKIKGIDIGFPGILRRLGIHTFENFTKILPWDEIQAFDYQTGNIQIKMAHNNLNTLHPSELADILEDAGNKERLGIVAALDAKNAAAAIEESNDETQVSILEELPINKFRDVLNRIHAPQLADILAHFHTTKKQEITNALGEEKAARVKRLLKFEEDEAGGLMHPTFTAFDSSFTIKEIIRKLQAREKCPEVVIVTNGNGKLVGTIRTKNLLNSDPLAIIKDLVDNKKFVFVDVSLEEIVKLFAAYNLRLLPVVNSDKQPIGVILIDDILGLLQEEKEHENI